MRSTVLSLLGALQLVSCGGSTPPVTVVGTASDIQALSGTWYGDYSSPITGRSGSILFELRAAGDSAFGRVVMTPHGATGALAPWRDARMPQCRRDVAQAPAHKVINNSNLPGARLYKLIHDRTADKPGPAGHQATCTS